MLAAILEFFDGLGEKHDDAPFVIAATHFHALKHQGLLKPSKSLRFKTMASELSENKLTHLFNISEETIASSRAYDCARSQGIDAVIVDRAVEVAMCIQDGKAVPRLDCGAAELENKRKILLELAEMDLSDGITEISEFLDRIEKNI